MLLKIILLAAVTLFFSVKANDKEVKVIKPPTWDIKRPCPNFKIECVRKEFIKRGWFDEDVGNQPDGEPLIIDDVIKAALPFYNATVYYHGFEITGLDKGKITEFYINKVTNKAVLSCEYCDLVVKSRVTLNLHRPRKENIQFLGPVAHEQYRSVQTTTIITGLKGPPELETHVDECIMKKFSYGEGIKKIKDKETLCKLHQIEKHIDIGTKETFVERAEILQDYFINNVIGKCVVPPPDEVPPPVRPPPNYASASAFATATA